MPVIVAGQNEHRRIAHGGTRFVAVSHLWKRTQEERRGRRARARVRKRFVYLQLEEASCRAHAAATSQTRRAAARIHRTHARERIPPRGPSDRAAGLETKTNTNNGRGWSRRRGFRC